MTKKEQLLEEAKAYGLSFAKNVGIGAIEKAIEAAKKEDLQEKAMEDAGGEIEITEKVESEDDFRARIEEEYKRKLESEMAKVTANLEVNMASKADEASNNRVLIGQAKLKARKEALALKRVIVSPKDPMKQNHEGDIFTAGNDVIGDVKKYIPYNVDTGWHVPEILLGVLRSKKCTVFVNKKVNGRSVQEPKIIDAYSIIELPPLTEDELSELAADQSARHAID